MSSGYETPYVTTLFGPRQPPPIPSAPLTPAEKAKATFIALLKIGGYLAILWAAGFLMLDGYIAGKLCYRLHTLPRADAKILSSEIYAERVSVPNPDGATSYREMYGFRSQVEFATDAEPAHLSLADIGYKKDDSSDLTKWQEAFPAGARTTIAYDPADPNRVLFAGDFWSAYARALVLSRFLAFVLGGGFLALWLAGKLQSPSNAG